MRNLKKTHYALIILCFIVVCIIGCSKSSRIIDDGNGHKIYKDNEGNLVRDSWVELKGKYYHFDLNGYLDTDKWVDNDYYVDSNGVMARDYWYNDSQGNAYYLDEDGKYAKNCVKTINGKEYGFNADGLRIKNAAIKFNDKGYYFDERGEKDSASGWKNVNGMYFYVGNDGNAVVNDWAEIDGKWYHFDSNGLMQVNTFVDNQFFVDENGEMVKNKELTINGQSYIFDNNGKAEAKVIDFNVINSKCCATFEDGSPYHFIKGMAEISSNKNELKIVANYPFRKEGLRWAKLINNELGLPLSLYTRMSNTNPNDGVKTETYNGIDITWKASTDGKTWMGGSIDNIEILYSK